MDRSLDEIIGERPQRPARGGGGGRRGDGRRPPPRAPRREEYPRDGVKKACQTRIMSLHQHKLTGDLQFRRDEPVNFDSDWVHDRFEDDRYDRSRREPEYEDRAPVAPRGGEIDGTRIRVDNIHYDLTEQEIRALFETKGPVSSVKLLYDRMDRSQGTAFVVYYNPRDAQQAIRDFDNQLASGQYIRLSLVPPAPAGRGPAAGGSLFDRIQRPARSLFERMEGGAEGSGDRRRRQRSDSPRRSDVRGPPPENVDRYVPGRGSRSPIRRRGTPRGGARGAGRRPGERGERKPRVDDGGRPLVGGRPRKTAEELDAEMEDYFTKPEEGNAPQNGNDAAGDDIDMVI